MLDQNIYGHRIKGLTIPVSALTQEISSGGIDITGYTSEGLKTLEIGLQNADQIKIGIQDSHFNIYSGGSHFGGTLTASTIYSGNTELGQLVGSLISSSAFNGGLVTGDTNFSGSLSATTLYSGSTNITSLFARNVHTHSISEVNGLQTHLGKKANLSGATFTASSAGSTPLISKGVASQTADLFKIQNSSSVDLFRVDYQGNFSGKTFSGYSINLAQMKSSVGDVRMVEADVIGNLNAHEVLMPYEVLNPDEILKLIATSAWTSDNVYTGSSFDNSYVEQEMFYYDLNTRWFYRFIDNQTPVRWSVADISSGKADLSGATFTGDVVIVSSSASNTPLTVRGATSQSADLFQIKNSAGTTLVDVDNSGNLTLNGTTTIAAQAGSFYSSSAQFFTAAQSLKLPSSGTESSSADNGLIRYNTTSNRGRLRENSQWVNIVTTTASTELNEIITEQTKDIVWSGITTGDTATEIFIEGVAGSRMSMPDNTSKHLFYKVHATRTDIAGEHSYGIYTVIIQRLSGTVTRPFVVATVYAGGNSLGSIDINADDVNKTVKVSATGIAGKTVSWDVRITSMSNLSMV